MKCYFLLRSNRESGPFSSEQLRTFGLLPSDLVWVEGESYAWEHPANIEELKAVMKDDVKKDTSVTEATVFPSSVKPPVPSLQEYRQALGSEEVYLDEDSDENPAYYYKSKTVFPQRRTPSTNSFSVGSGFFGAVILLIGLVLCGFVVVNMLGQFSSKQAASSDAVEIKSEVLPPSNVSHTARAATQFSVPSQTTMIAPTITDTTTHLKTALEKKPVRPLAETARKIRVPKRDTTTHGTSPANTETPKDEMTKPVEEKEPAPSVNRTPSLQLSANDYKVGLFGGVSDLEILVTNPSAQKIDKAVIEIEFLKPNGSVVKSQTVATENISPNGSTRIAVPSSGRGVKVRYHVVSVDVQN